MSATQQTWDEAVRMVMNVLADGQRVDRYLRRADDGHYYTTPDETYLSDDGAVGAPDGRNPGVLRRDRGGGRGLGEQPAPRTGRAARRVTLPATDGAAPVPRGAFTPYGERPMTVKQLIAALKEYPPDTLVRLMSDPEGNEDRPLHEVGDFGDPEDRRDR